MRGLPLTCQCNEEMCEFSTCKCTGALLYMAENGCKWRCLPAHFGKWPTIHQRMSRWSKSGVLERVFERLKAQRNIPPEALSIDSTSIKVHPDGTGALKKTAGKPLEDLAEAGLPRFIGLPPASAMRCSSLCRPATRTTRLRGASCCARWEGRRQECRC